MMKSKQTIDLTLVVVCKGFEILLGMKKRGFGKGKWNGFGGKVEAGERVEGAAKRELFEEAFIEAEKIEKMGFVEFRFRENLEEKLAVHIFKVDEFSGEPQESEEMVPKWFNIREIPCIGTVSKHPFYCKIIILAKFYKNFLELTLVSPSKIICKIYLKILIFRNKIVLGNSPIKNVAR